MTKPLHDLINAFHPPPVGGFRPLEHDDRNTKLARRIDFGSRAGSARIAGDDPFDPAGTHYFQFALKREWPARHDNVGLSERQRFVGGIDKPQRVGVLRLGSERGDVLPTDRKKYVRALDRQRRDSGSDIGYLDPVIARHSGPWRTFDRDQLCSSPGTRRNRVAAHLGREGMGCIDNMRNPFPANVFGKSARTAESTDSGRQLLVGRRARASAVGIDGVESGKRDGIRKQMSVACSAQNEGAHHA